MKRFEYLKYIPSESTIYFLSNDTRFGIVTERTHKMENIYFQTSLFNFYENLSKFLLKFVEVSYMRIPLLKRVILRCLASGLYLRALTVMKVFIIRCLIAWTILNAACCERKSITFSPEEYRKDFHQRISGLRAIEVLPKEGQR